MAGTTFKSWTLAVTSIGNIYRHERSVGNTYTSQGANSPRASAFTPPPMAEKLQTPTVSTEELNQRLAALSSKLAQTKTRG
jgi:hypothetical protein